MAFQLDLFPFCMFYLFIFGFASRSTKCASQPPRFSRFVGVSFPIAVCTMYDGFVFSFRYTYISLLLLLLRNDSETNRKIIGCLPRFCLSPCFTLLLVPPLLSFSILAIEMEKFFPYIGYSQMHRNV